MFLVVLVAPCWMAYLERWDLPLVVDLDMRRLVLFPHTVSGTLSAYLARANHFVLPSRLRTRAPTEVPRSNISSDR